MHRGTTTSPPRVAGVHIGAGRCPRTTRGDSDARTFHAPSLPGGAVSPARYPARSGP
jgi:hypothetical protein